MRKKTKILFISPFILDGAYGGSMGSRSKLDLLSQTFSVTSLSFPRRQDRNAKICADIELQGTKSKFRTALSNLILLSGRLTLDSLKSLKAIINKKEHDLVFLDTSYYGWVARYCRKIGVPCVAMIHNVEFDFEMSRLKSGQWTYFPSFISAYVNEYLTTKNCNALISLHKTDGIRLSNLYGCKVDFQWPVLMEDCASRLDNLHKCSVNRDVRKILFVGTSFHGNIQAVQFFISHVLSQLSVELNVKFQIVGRGFENHKDLERLDSRIEVHGQVENVEPFYAEADIVIAPIFSGAGMKVKIAEAMMYGKKIVASPFALIGYEDSVDDDNLIACSNPEEYVSSITRILNSGAIYSCRNRSEFNLKYSYSAAMNYIAQLFNYINKS